MIAGKRADQRLKIEVGVSGGSRVPFFVASEHATGVRDVQASNTSMR